MIGEQEIMKKTSYYNELKRLLALSLVLGLLFGMGIMPVDYERGCDKENFTPPITAASTSFNVANSAELSAAISSLVEDAVNVINITESFTYTSRVIFESLFGVTAIS